MTDPHGTETFPHERRRYQTGPAVITALGLFGKGVYLPMLPAQPTFTLGTAVTCNLRVDEKYHSPRHARIERVEAPMSGIRVTNVSSGKNDLVVRGDVAKLTFTMEAGDWFEIGETRYFALSDEMRLAAPTIMEILGAEKYAEVDEVLIAAVSDSSKHLILTGEPGCDQDRLGRIIHQVSHRRSNLFSPIQQKRTLDIETSQIIRDCNNGSLLIHLHERGAVGKRLISAVTDSAARLRLILCAPTRKKVEASFPPSVTNNSIAIPLTPLRERVAEIPGLMDQQFIDDYQSEVRFATLPAQIQSRLAAYDWPKNLQELRQSVEYLVYLAKYKTPRAVEKNSHITRSILRGWMERIGIPDSE